MLHIDRQMVAPAVEAFYERDPHGMKAASFLTNAKELGDFIETPVLFTRCLYAMIAQQDFHAPKGWPVPLDSSKRSNSLGLKLTYGFEILLTGGGRKFNRVGDMASWDAWLAEMEALGAPNRGSRNKESYHSVIEAARALFHDFQQDESGTVDDSAVEAMDSDVDDSDDWLSSAARESVISEELDRRRREIEGDEVPYSPNMDAPDSQNRNDPTLDAGIVYDKMSTFMNSESSLEGVEIIPEVSESAFNFDVAKFMSSLDNILSGTVAEDQSSVDGSAQDDLELSDGDDDDTQFVRAYDECLAEELIDSQVGKSFEFRRHAPEAGDGADPDDGSGTFESGPDVAESVAHNLELSYTSEIGQSGPASNLLASLKIVRRDENDTGHKSHDAF